MQQHWLWTTGRTSQNTKTGQMPTAYPANIEEAFTSCEGCPLRKGQHRFRRNHNHPECYFWYGQGIFGLKHIIAAWQRGKRYDLAYALSKRPKSARAVRMSGGGDPSSTPPAEYLAYETAVRAEKLSWLDYTHFWKSKGSWLKGHAMASCDTWGDAIKAVHAGWRATVHVKSLKKFQGTVRGIRYTLCPAQRPGKTVTCNQCRLCDASKAVVPIIVFLNH